MSQPTIIDIDRYDGVLLLNEQGDLYILLHNIGVQIIPFKSEKKFQTLLEGKKDIASSVHRAPYTGISIIISKNEKLFSGLTSF